MNINIYIYLFFQKVLTSSIDNKHESSTGVIDLENPTANVLSSEIHETNSFNSDEKGEDIDEKYDTASDEETTSSDINDYSDEDSDYDPFDILFNHFKIDTYDNPEIKFDFVKVQIPDSVDQDFIKENNIPFEKFCDLHKFFVEMFNITSDFGITFCKFVRKEIEAIETYDINRRTYHRKYEDLSILMELSILITEIHEHFNISLNDTVIFFDLLGENDIEAINAAKKFKIFNSFVLLRFKRFVSIIKKLKLENVSESMKEFSDLLLEKRRELKKILN